MKSDCNRKEQSRSPLPVDLCDESWTDFWLKPNTPRTSRCIYAVGDIHGYDNLFEAMLNEIMRDLTKTQAAEPLIVFLGDYIDRGPNSKRVVELLAGATALPPVPTVFIRGNHDQWLLDFIEDCSVLSAWGPKGGLETLVSYGIPKALIQAGMKDQFAAEETRNRFLNLLPPSHLAFFRSLVSHYVLDDYFFVHAGVDPDRPLDQQRNEDLTWIRHKFLESKKDFGKIIVHGHTPCERVESLPNRINADGGIYMRGILNCVVLEGTGRFLISVSKREIRSKELVRA